MSTSIEYYAEVAKNIEFKDGKPYWIVNRGRVKSGTLAGCINKSGYRVICSTINKKSKLLYAHRIHWYMQYKTLPKIIDHIDRDPDNNRVSNLRIASHSQNMRNIRPRGVSKYTGVAPHQGKWTARITCNYKNTYLGIFKTQEEAARAYDKFCIENNLTFANLNFKE